MNGVQLPDTQTASFAHTVAAQAVIIEAVNPSGTAAEGALAIYPGWTLVDSGGEDPGATVTRSPANRITVALPATAAFPVTMTARARNDCGDSEIVVSVQKP